VRAGDEDIALRSVTMGDQEMVFRWRNDPIIVAQGSSQREVEREEHSHWFEETVSGNKRKMFIVLNQENPIGQVRFDRESQNDCVISIYLLRAFLGRGWGVQAIRMGCTAVFEEWDVERVVACVRSDNNVGRSAFLKAGFRETGALDLCPIEHYSLVLTRSSSALQVSSRV
jgi:RimJ/RimL family protein N-acetyltransferase